MSVIAGGRIPILLRIAKEAHFRTEQPAVRFEIHGIEHPGGRHDTFACSGRRLCKENR